MHVLLANILDDADQVIDQSRRPATIVDLGIVEGRVVDMADLVVDESVGQRQHQHERVDVGGVLRDGHVHHVDRVAVRGTQRMAMLHGYRFTGCLGQRVGDDGERTQHSLAALRHVARRDRLADKLVAKVCLYLGDVIHGSSLHAHRQAGECGPCGRNRGGGRRHEVGLVCKGKRSLVGLALGGSVRDDADAVFDDGLRANKLLEDRHAHRRIDFIEHARDGHVCQHRLHACGSGADARIEKSKGLELGDQLPDVLELGLQHAALATVGFEQPTGILGDGIQQSWKRFGHRTAVLP